MKLTNQKKNFILVAIRIIFNDCFSNWVVWSSSFSLFIVYLVSSHPGHASLRSLVDAL